MNQPVLRLGVLISGSGSNLQAIIDYIESARLPCSVQLVVSNDPAAYGLERAAKAGIQTEVVEHRQYDSREQFDQAMHDRLSNAGVEILLLAGFMRILSHWFVHTWSGRMLNIHPALLPHFKGLNTHQRAIDSGASTHGATVHLVTPELDDGPNILQGSIAIHAGESAEQLQQRVHQVEHLIYPKVVEWLASGRLIITETGATLDNQPITPRGMQIEYPEI